MSRPQSTAREAEPEVAVQIDSASVRGGVFGPMLASVLLYGLWADFLLPQAKQQPLQYIG